LDCREYSRSGRGSEGEIFFWSSLGHPQDEHFSAFDYPKPVCLLFTGQFGGSVWSIDNHFHTPFDRPDWSGLGLSGFRLWSSIIDCPVPFWGGDRAEDIHAIGKSPEMKEWILGGEYDRPVPRRLVEEAGVARNSFGMRKSATHYDDVFLWPTRKELREDYAAYLRKHGIAEPPVRFARKVAFIYSNLIFPIENRFLGRTIPRALWKETRGLLFQWANEKLAQELREIL
jgi:hypothetical protein